MADMAGLVAPAGSVAGTRTSHRWAQPPGNWDRLNCRALFPSGNEWGIPDLAAATELPDGLASYSSRAECDAAERANRAGGKVALHYFIDDYRFEACWSKPERALPRVQRVGLALTPDFSLWRDMPLGMQLWQAYRARWCGAWMAAHGARVIPTAGWSDARSYAFAFAGIAAGSVVAISAVGTGRDPVARGLFASGYRAMLDAVRPAAVLCYGPLPATVAGEGPPVRCYPSRWEGR